MSRTGMRKSLIHLRNESCQDPSFNLLLSHIAPYSFQIHPCDAFDNHNYFLDYIVIYIHYKKCNIQENLQIDNRYHE